MIKTIIFDMDGVLIDSEPLWKEAEEATLQSFGFETEPADFEQTWGIRTDEVVRFHLAKNPGLDLEVNAVVEAIEENLISLVRDKASPMPGVYEAISFLKEEGFAIEIGRAHV